LIGDGVVDPTKKGYLSKNIHSMSDTIQAY
jgi:hypothetical protein